MNTFQEIKIKLLHRHCNFVLIKLTHTAHNNTDKQIKSQT